MRKILLIILSIIIPILLLIELDVIDLNEFVIFDFGDDNFISSDDGLELIEEECELAYCFDYTKEYSNDTSALIKLLDEFGENTELDETDYVFVDHFVFVMKYEDNLFSVEEISALYLYDETYDNNAMYRNFGCDHIENDDPTTCFQTNATFHGMKDQIPAGMDEITLREIKDAIESIDLFNAISYPDFIVTEMDYIDVIITVHYTLVGEQTFSGNSAYTSVASGNEIQEGTFTLVNPVVVLQVVAYQNNRQVNSTWITYDILD